MNKVELFVNGKIFDGWKEAEMTFSLKAIAASFNLSITDKWSSQNQPWIVSPDDECVIKVDGETVITGFIDSSENSFTATSRAINVSGRDKTSAIVDCSFLGNGEYNNISLKTLAELVAKPFNIPVISQDVGAVFEAVKLNQGDTGFEILERYAKQKGFLLTTDGLGSIVISRPSKVKSKTMLEQGKNILEGSATFDHTDRFSDYIAKGQKPDQLALTLNPNGSYQIKASAKDPVVLRYKPMLIVNEGFATLSQAATRAQWEAKVRAAKAAKFRVSVVGWRKQDGSLWRPNELVNLKSTYLGVEAELLITSVRYSKSATAGTICQIEMERPDAYLPEPTIKKETDPLVTNLRNNLQGKPVTSVVAPKVYDDED